jgi:hypothetical protein
MCNETGKSVKFEIYSVRKGTLWNLSNDENVVNPYYDSTKFCENFCIYYFMARKQGVFIIKRNKFQ